MSRYHDSVLLVEVPLHRQLWVTQRCLHVSCELFSKMVSKPATHWDTIVDRVVGRRTILVRTLMIWVLAAMSNTSFNPVPCPHGNLLSSFGSTPPPANKKVTNNMAATPSSHSP